MCSYLCFYKFLLRVFVQDSALHVELQSCMREVAQLQQRLQSCMQQLARKESELCREQEDVKKAHQQIHQLREQVNNNLCASSATGQ